MSTVHEPVTSDQHLIEHRGENSYWVLRYEATPQYSQKSFSRVVFFARSRDDAESYIQRYSRLRA